MKCESLCTVVFIKSYKRNNKLYLESQAASNKSLKSEKLRIARHKARQRRSVIEIRAEALSATESTSFQLKLRVINNLNNGPEVV